MVLTLQMKSTLLPSNGEGADVGKSELRKLISRKTNFQRKQ